MRGAESAGRGNRALTKDPGRKPRVCIKTSVQVKLKEGLRELRSYLCWSGEGQGGKRKLVAGRGINGVAGSGWGLGLPEARHPLSPLCWGRQCPSPHLGLRICGASLCVMNRIQEDKPRAGVCQGGDQGGWLSQLAPLVTLSFPLFSFPLLVVSKPHQCPREKLRKDSLMLSPALCTQANGSRYDRRDRRILGTVTEHTWPPSARP